MKYIITETQYKGLIKKKRNEKVANQILEEINSIKKNLKESMRKNAIESTLKKYNKKGLVNETVKSILSDNNIIINQ